MFAFFAFMFFWSFLVNELEGQKRQKFINIKTKNLKDVNTKIKKIDFIFKGLKLF